MAHILKHPTDKIRGIIVFTHKEMRFFKRSAIVPFLNYSKHLRKIREKYFVGAHFGGWRIDLYDFCEFVDFAMLTESAAAKLRDRRAPFIIPLVSRNFTPEIFCAGDQEGRFWDILCVSSNSRVKNLDLFLREVKKIYEAGHKLRILLISPVRKNEERGNKYYNSLERDYIENFTPAERELFTLHRPGAFHGFLGMSQTALSHWYRSSKVFTLFSVEEGGSKVISEALLSGLKIVVKRDLDGGGRDYLNDDNAVCFQDFDVAWKALIEAVEHYKEYRPDLASLRDNLGEEGSLSKLKTHFATLFGTHGCVFDNELINVERLNLRLPAHMSEGIPWGAGYDRTSDILTRKQFSIFLQHLRL